jgi:hypothetical protein
MRSWQSPSAGWREEDDEAMSAGVMAGLDPGIHVFRSAVTKIKDVDARVKAGHDGKKETGSK